MLKEIFGRNLKYYRRRKGWTQEELAELLDMSPQYISRLESGRHSPSFDVIEWLVEILEVRPDQLFREKKEIIKKDLKI